MNVVVVNVIVAVTVLVVPVKVVRVAVLVVVVDEVWVVVDVLVVPVLVVTVAVVAVVAVIVVVVNVPVEDVVVVIVVVDNVLMHVPHKLRHRSRTCTPTALFSWHEEAVYILSCPHSLGSGTPLHKPVVVDVVAVVVVVVVEATQESQAIGQRERRAGNAWHCADVTPLQPSAGSAVRVGSAPLQSSQSVPDQGWSQAQV